MNTLAVVSALIRNISAGNILAWQVYASRAYRKYICGLRRVSRIFNKIVNDNLHLLFADVWFNNEIYNCPAFIINKLCITESIFFKSYIYKHNIKHFELHNNYQDIIIPESVEILTIYNSRIGNPDLSQHKNLKIVDIKNTQSIILPAHLSGKLNIIFFISLCFLCPSLPILFGIRAPKQSDTLTRCGMIFNILTTYSALTKPGIEPR